MPVLDKTNEKELKRYEDYVKSVKDAHFMQDPRWSYVLNNLTPEYVTIEENGKIVGAATVYVRPIALNRNLLYVKRGPIVTERTKENITKIVKEMEPLIKKYNAFAVRFDPNWDYSEELINELKDKKINIRGRGFSKKYLVMSRKTMSFKLNNRSLDEIISSFKSSTKRHIKKGLSSGLTLETGFTKENIDEFMKILDITCKRQKIILKPREFYEEIGKHFTDDEARLYLIKKDDEYLSGCVTMNYGGRVYYYYGGSTNEKRDLEPNCFMQYTQIKWAQETSAHTYDLGGIIREDLSDGLYRFKIGFCNEEPTEEFIGEIDYIIKPIEYKLFLISYKLMQDYLTRKVTKQLKN